MKVSPILADQQKPFAFWQCARLIVRRSGLAILLLTLATTLVEQTLTSTIHSELNSPQGTGPLLWIAILLSVVISLLAPIVSCLLAIAALYEPPILQTFRHFFQQLLIENLRALGSTLSWSLLFILPGVYRFIQYSFVNFIVVLDDDYQLGKVDALQKSRKLTKRRFFFVLAIFALMALIVPLLLSAFDDYSLLLDTPISGFLIVLLEVLLFIALNLILFQQWRNAHGPDL